MERSQGSVEPTGGTAPSRRRPRDRRDRIIAAATDLYAERGYHGVSMASVARAVGVTPAALYRHFEGREDLFATAIQRSADRILETLTEARGLEESDEMALEAMVRATTKLALEHPASLRIVLRDSDFQVVNPPGVPDSRARVTELWLSPLLRSRPRLTEIEAVLLLRGAMGVPLGNLVEAAEPDARSAPILERMMLAVLATPKPREARDAASKRHGAEKGDRVGPSRREEILNAAASLFRRNGYEGVGMDEIGATAGTSGPGIYRHFRTKEELLITTYRRTGHRISAEAAQVVETAESPGDALRGLIASYSSVALANEDLLAVYLREAASLPPDERNEMLAIQDEVFATWARVMAHHRPDLAAADARAVALATIGILNATLPSQDLIEAPARRAWSTAAAWAAVEAA